MHKSYTPCSLVVSKQFPNLGNEFSVPVYRYISVTIMKGCGRFVGGYSIYLGVVCHIVVGCSFYLGVVQNTFGEVRSISI